MPSTHATPEATQQLAQAHPQVPYQPLGSTGLMVSAAGFGGYRVDVEPEGLHLFMAHRDRPGVIGAIGSTIGKHKINIARMTVGQERERGQNIILLTTDTPITPECLKDLQALEHVAQAIPLEL